MADRKTLAELAAESGIPARTIRFYIARGLLDGPVKSGRDAVYTSLHSDRLTQIRDLQNRSLTLNEIARKLGGEDSEMPPAAASPWWQHVLADDVIVMTRADASPWRIRQLQDAIRDMANRVATPVDQDERKGKRK